MSPLGGIYVDSRACISGWIRQRLNYPIAELAFQGRVVHGAVWGNCVESVSERLRMV